jgi:sugar lactone lactonase YvrE
MSRRVLCFVWLIGLVVAACSSVLPNAVRVGRMTNDLGFAGGPALEARVSEGVFAVKAPAATVGNVAAYVFELWDQTGPTLRTSYATAAAACRFLQVPDGTYFLKVGAFDSGGNPLIEGGASVASANTATVIAPGITYSSGASLAVTLQLRHQTDAVIPVAVTAPFGTSYRAVLHSGGTTVATYTSPANLFTFRGVADGTYGVWAYAYNGSGQATPVRPTDAVTVSGLRSVVSGAAAVGIPATIAAVAGGGAGDGGLATVSAQMDFPDRVVEDAAGNLIIGELTNKRVRMLCRTPGTYFGQTMTANRIYTIAGTGGSTLTGIGGPATAADVGSVNGLALDGVGNVYIGDVFSKRVLMLPQVPGTYFGQAMTAGNLYLLAGNGSTVHGGDGGPASAASFDGPRGLAVDASGNVYLSTAGNHRIRVIAATTGTVFGVAVTAGNIYTIAGTGTGAFGGDGAAATAATVNQPYGMALDATGNLVFADSLNNRVRMIARTSGTYYGVVMTANSIYTVAGTGTAAYAGDGGAGPSANLNNPNDVAVAANGTLYIGDTGNNRVRRVTTAGTIFLAAGNGGAYAFGGDGGAATSATMGGPYGVGSGTSNILYICDVSNDRVRMVPPTGGTYFGQVMTAGNIYTIAGAGLDTFGGEDSPASGALLGTPTMVTYDPAGNLYIADTTNSRVRMVPASNGTYFGITMTAGNIYTIAGTTIGYAGNAGPAVNAKMNFPQGLAVDSLGNVIVLDTFNRRVRVIAKTSGTYYGVAMTANNFYVIAGTGSNAFAGDGGPASSAAFNDPRRMGIDAQDNLYIADSGNHRIRMIPKLSGTYWGIAMTANNVYTVAGNGSGAFAGDGGTAASASLNNPQVPSFDGQGNLYIGDSVNYRVRMVPRVSGTYFGQTMAANNIYTIAGNGVFTYAGDGGPATSASLRFPNAVACDDFGNAYVADVNNCRIRMIDRLTGTIYTVAGNGTNSNTGDGGLAINGTLDFPTFLTFLPSGRMTIISKNFLRTVF